MKKTTAFLSLLLGICMLAGCTPTNPGSSSEEGGIPTLSPEEAFQTAINSQMFLMDASTGKEHSIGKGKFTLKEYNSFIATKQMEYRGTTIDIAWTASPADKFVLKDYEEVEEGVEHIRIIPNFQKEIMENCKLTAAFSVKNNTELTYSTTWTFDVAAHNLTLDDYTYMSIESIQTKYSEGKLFEGTSIANLKAYSYGKITATFEQSSAHIYSGIFVGDGNYAIQLYAGKSSDLWWSNGLSTGDIVVFGGTFSEYNGLIELKPDVLEKVSFEHSGDNYTFDDIKSSESVTVTEPKELVMQQGRPFNNSICKYQGRIITFPNLTFSKTTTKPSLSVHGTLVFTDSTGFDVTVYVNYHLGSKIVNEILTVLDGMKKDDNYTVKGVISVYNQPQIVPVFGADSFIKAN